MSYADLTRSLTVAFRPISTWPGPLSGDRRHAPFRAGLQATTRTLRVELHHLNAKNVVIELAMREEDFRIDGAPRANAKACHPGIIVSIDTRYGPLRYAVDTFLTWQDNLRAVALAMEALRKIDRYGVTRRGEQYTGWRQLPETSSVSLRERGEVLVSEHGGLREALKATHPDRGGSREDFLAVMAVKDAADA